MPHPSGPLSFAAPTPFDLSGHLRTRMLLHRPLGIYKAYCPKCLVMDAAAGAYRGGLQAFDKNETQDRRRLPDPRTATGTFFRPTIACGGTLKWQQLYSEASRVGQESGSTCRDRWWP